MEHFFKKQTKWMYVPPAISACIPGHRGTTIRIGMWSGHSTDPDHPCEDCKKQEHADIELTANEALALAAWLQAAADQINRRLLASEKKKAARAAKKAEGKK